MLQMLSLLSLLATSAGYVQGHVAGRDVAYEAQGGAIYVTEGNFIPFLTLSEQPHWCRNYIYGRATPATQFIEMVLIPSAEDLERAAGRPAGSDTFYPAYVPGDYVVTGSEDVGVSLDRQLKTAVVHIGQTGRSGTARAQPATGGRVHIQSIGLSIVNNEVAGGAVGSFDLQVEGGTLRGELNVHGCDD